MVLQAILEGLGLGALLVLVCAAAIRKGAVHMVHLYHADVQARCVALGLTTREKIRQNSTAGGDPAGVHRRQRRRDGGADLRAEISGGDRRPSVHRA